MSEQIELLAKFFSKARIIDDPLLDKLLKLDDLRQKVYNEHRIKKGFYQAELLANEAVIIVVLN